MSAYVDQLCEEVSQKIIDEIESGKLGKWKCPWFGSGLPKNLKTQKDYRGCNISFLWLASNFKKHDTNYFLTYKQAKELGGYVKKGEKGIPVVFFKKLDDNKETNTKQNTEDKKPLIVNRSYTVFNLDQVEIEQDKIKDLVSIPSQTINPIEKAEKFISSIPHDVEFAGASAYYSPSKDKIVLPTKDRFKTSEDFYRVYLHELSHWTGHKSRLDRKKGSAKGSSDYAYEELIAELSSAFLCASLGLKGNFQHAEYLDSYAKIMSDDPKIILKASGAAQRSFDLIQSFQEENQEENQNQEEKEVA